MPLWPEVHRALTRLLNFLRTTEKHAVDITKPMGNRKMRTKVTNYAPLLLAKELVPLWRQRLKPLGARPFQIVWDFTG